MSTKSKILNSKVTDKGTVILVAVDLPTLGRRYEVRDWKQRYCYTARYGKAMDVFDAYGK